MKILIVGLKKNSQALRLKEEAARRGHILETCLSTELTITSDRLSFNPTLRGVPLDFDLIYMLTVTESRRYLWKAVCEYLDRCGVVIVNRSLVSHEFNFNPNVAKELLELSQQKISYPKTVTFTSSKSAEYVLTQIDYPFILKVGEIHKGESVHKIDNKDQFIAILDELKKTNGTLLARQFIPNDDDIRVFVIDGKAVGAMKRVGKAGEFRSNISLGGEGSPYDLESNKEVRLIAEKAAKATNIDIAGVDVIIDKHTGELYVLEVNTGPQIGGIEKFTGINIAEQIIIFFEKLKANQ